MSLTRKKDEMKKNVNKTIKTKKNNKMSTVSEDKAYISMDMPFLSPPRIDGIAIVIDMPDAQLHGQTLHEILCGVESGEFKAIKKQVKMYTVAACIPCPDVDGVIDHAGPSVCIMATPKDTPNRHIRIKFNPEKLLAPLNGIHPAKMLEPALDYLDVTFQGMCGLSFFELLAHGRVTSIDVHRQIASRSPDDYMFAVKYAQTSQSIFGKGGKLETQYFGKQASNQVAIYDKAREMFGSETEQAITRIECRLKPKKMKVHGLWSMKNPFAKIVVHSLKCDNPPYGLAHWVAFKDSCRFRGVAKAIALQPKSHQHQLKKAVSALPVPWWSMGDDDWTYFWHAALEDCCLNLIPDHASPLTIAEAAGMAA